MRMPGDTLAGSSSSSSSSGGGGEILRRILPELQLEGTGEARVGSNNTEKLRKLN